MESEAQTEKEQEIAFSEELNKISNAEKKASLIIENAYATSGDIIKQANQEASNIISDALKQSVELNNKIIAQYNNITKKQTQKIISDALKQAEKIKLKTLTHGDIKNLVEFLVE
jgi:vacuolar-type H+-ATPase subunit H